MEEFITDFIRIFTTCFIIGCSFLFVILGTHYGVKLIGKAINWMGNKFAGLF